MTYLPENLDDVSETTVVPIGNYELQVVEAEEVVSGEKSKHPGSPMIKVTLAFTDLDLNAMNIMHYISLPYGADDESGDYKLLLLKRFLAVFRVAYNTNLTELAFSFIGATSNLDVGLSEPNVNGNVYNTIQLPRIKKEATKRSRR